MDNTFLKKANLEIIRYANCWEDADILLRALNPNPGCKILSIASAGDNSFALLHSNPEKVVAIDLNWEQLYLTELKQVAIKHLEYKQFLEFVGVSPSQDRLTMFHAIKVYLKPKTQNFWVQNQKHIINGIIYCGKFEKYFLLFRKYLLPLVHSSNVVRKLFKPKSAAEQEHFYRLDWNTWRWRLLFKIFFSKFVMGRFGRDPEFLKQVDINVQQFIFSRAEKHLSDVHCQYNYFLAMIMSGEYQQQLPFYMREENYEQIKNNIDKLQLMYGYAQDAVRQGEKFHYMNLSNIFEYMPEPVFREVADSLFEGMYSGGKIAYWNLMVERKLSAILPEKIISIPISNEMRSADCGFFYRDFICDECQ